MPASIVHACLAALIAKTMNSSTLRCSFGSIHWSGLYEPFVPSPRGIMQAIWQAISKHRKRSTRDAPLLPGEDIAPGRLDAATERRHHSKGPSRRPRRMRTPAIVRRKGPTASQAVFFSRNAQRRTTVNDGLRPSSGTRPELLLERHDELDRIEAVSAQIVEEVWRRRPTFSPSTPRCSMTIFFTRSRCRS